MTKVFMSILTLSILLGCDEKKQDTVEVAGHNFAKFTRYEKPKNLTYNYGEADPGTSVECLRDKKGHVTVVAYRFGNENNIQIEEAWQIYETQPEQDTRFHFELKSKEGDEYPPVVYYDGKRLYQVDGEVPCNLVYQRKDDWLVGSIACLTLVTEGEAPVFVSGTFQCLPQATLSFRVDQKTYQQLKASP